MNSVDTTINITTIGSKKPNTKQELIAANIKLLIEQLEAGHSEALTNYLTAMSRFHNYSFGNVLEIARRKGSPQSSALHHPQRTKNPRRGPDSACADLRCASPFPLQLRLRCKGGRYPSPLRLATPAFARRRSACRYMPRMA